MRTTLDIDDDVLAAARAMAREQRKPLGYVLSQLARRGLAPPARRAKTGLPVFDVPADAPRITPDMVDRAVDED